MAESRAEREFKQLQIHCEQAFKRDRVQMIPPRPWKIRHDRWAVHGFNATRTIFDEIKAVVVPLIVSLNRETMGNIARQNQLGAKVMESLGACSDVILLVIRFGTLDMLRQYSEYILKDTLELYAKTLPLRKEILSQIFRMDVEKLFQHQYLHFSPIIEEGAFGVKIDPRSKMPYLEETDLGNEGVSGKVYKVKIASRHFRQLSIDTLNDGPFYLARKDFHVDEGNPADDHGYQNEINAYQAFSKTQGKHDNIAVAIGSIIYGPDSKLPIRSIFFELAKSDLDGFLRDKNSFPGFKQLSQQLHNIRQMINICHALAWLAKVFMYDASGDAMTRNEYYHCDLKPANILVYEHPRNAKYITFKLSDFGETQRWKLRLKPEKHSLTKFLKAPQTSRHRTSVASRDGTYCAPERTKGKDSYANDRSDIWSLGCIFLLVISANIGGYQEVDSFSNARLRRNKDCCGYEGDWFYEYDKTPISYPETTKKRVNAKVTERIENLLKHCSNTGDALTERCLILVKSKMIRPDPDDRATAESLYKKLSMSYNERYATKFISIDHDRELAEKERVYSAATSQSGKLEGFLCKNTIYVWNTQLSRFTSSPILLHTHPADNEQNFKPILLCGEDKVCKVGSIDNNLELELYTLEWSASTANRSDKTVVRFQLSSDSIQCATLSSNGKYLAIACRSATQDGFPDMANADSSKIILFSIDQFFPDFEESPLAELTATPSSSSHDSDAGLPIPNNLLENVTSEKVWKIEHLMFSANNRYLYRVIRHLRGNSHGGQVSLTVWEMDETAYPQFESQIHDDVSSNANGGKNGRLLMTQQTPASLDDVNVVTSMSPLHKKVGFIGSLYPNTIVQYTPESEHQITKLPVKGVADIRNVFITRNDDFVVILACRANKLVILGATWNGIEKCKSKKEPLWPTELDISGNLEYASERGDRACLLERDDALFLLLSRPDKRKSFTIDLSRFFISGSE